MRIPSNSVGLALALLCACSSKSTGNASRTDASTETGGATGDAMSTGGLTGTGGAIGLGGTTGTGGNGGSTTGTMRTIDAGPPRACDSLAAPGVWEKITPNLSVLPGAAPCPYGGAFVMNPIDPAVVYLGTCNQGVWKTTDCGAGWVHINTGKNGGALDSGRQWTFTIDPTNPDVLYTNSGYNTWVPAGTWDGNGVSGAFKSSNGGIDWDVLWPPKDATLANLVQYNFVGQVVLDPSDARHVLVTFHATCTTPHPEACFVESTDAGGTWRVVDGQSDWVGGEGQAVYFLDNSHTWLWGSQSNGLWRTTDSGKTWAAVTDKQAQGHGAGQLYRAKTGAFYLPVLNGMLRSPDGITWTIVPDSGSIMAGCTGNGTTMWASRGFPWDPSTNLYLPFWSSSESDGMTWTQMTSPMLSNGGQLAYDSSHKLLYSSNLGEGFWRVMTE
jgi:hypothetical protein